MMSAAMLVTATAASVSSSGNETLPHLMFILQDDLGAYDSCFNGNAVACNTTGNVTKMANEGIILTRHYVFYWCSPTRRSLLTGRLPLHHGEMLSANDGDDVDLRWNLITQKLAPLGYQSYWYGKGHTGYKSIHHLPTHRGFLNFTGYLTGSQSYTSNDRWFNEEPLTSEEYSTNLYGESVLTTLESHDPVKPFFLYLPWQAVHSPYDDVPGWVEGPGRSTYQGMLWATDVYAGKIRTLLEAKGMWENMLVVYSSDNGGRGSGINYPLRGEKRTNYDGGMRVTAFVSGGLIPQALRGTSNDIRFHIVDWYPTFCRLVGISSFDGSPTPPEPVDPTNPDKDIYGNNTWPDIDGIDIWDMLMKPSKYNTSSAHPTLVLSREVLIRGNYKIMTTQHGDTHQGAETYENRWQDQNGTWFAPAGWKQTCGFTVYNNGNDKFLPMTPCVFDLSVDANETTNLAVSQPELLHELWLELNISWLGYYHSRSPAALLGPCNMPCAGKKWSKMAGGLAVLGPVCAVPGCDAHPFTPTNSTDCKFMANTGFSNRVPDHPLGVNAASQADCCRACYEDAYCVASAFHKADKSNKCYLHQAPPHQTSNTGVTGCVTTRLATYSPHSIHTAEIEAVYSPRAVVEE